MQQSRARHILTGLAVAGSAVLGMGSSCTEGILDLDQVPVVQVLLIAGQSQQQAIVEWSFPPQTPTDGSPSPIDPSLVDLTLRDAVGSTAQFRSDVSSPLAFSISMLVSAGETYALDGAIAGTALEAEVTVPDAVEFLLPTSDTVWLEAGADATLRWVANGAGSFMVVGRDAPPPHPLSPFKNPWMTAATQVRLSEVPMLRMVSGDTVEVMVLALDPVSARYFDDLNRPGVAERTAIGNISGAFGLFGAASVASRVFIIQ